MSKLLNLRVSIAVVALSFVILVLVGYIWVGPGQGKTLPVYFDGPTFKLTDHLGQTVNSDQLKGKIVVANFVYVNCRETCPLLSARMQALQERLRREGLLDTHVQLLSFTVDPARDTTAVLRTYAERFQADPPAWRFLTGPEEEMVQVIQEGFKLGVQRVAAGESTLGAHMHDDGHEAGEPYMVKHSNRFVLLDRQWRIRAYYDGLDLDIDGVVRDIRQLAR